MGDVWNILTGSGVMVVRERVWGGLSLVVLGWDGYDPIDKKNAFCWHEHLIHSPPPTLPEFVRKNYL